MGELKVKFSTLMKNDSYNLTAYNSSIMDIYVAPSNDWHLTESNFSIDVLNMTWNVTSFESDEMKISLGFHKPFYISKYANQDDVVLHIK